MPCKAREAPISFDGLFTIVPAAFVSTVSVRLVSHLSPSRWNILRRGPLAALQAKTIWRFLVKDVTGISIRNRSRLIRSAATWFRCFIQGHKAGAIIFRGVRTQRLLLA